MGLERYLFIHHHSILWIPSGFICPNHIVIYHHKMFSMMFQMWSFNCVESKGLEILAIIFVAQSWKWLVLTSIQYFKLSLYFSDVLPSSVHPNKTLDGKKCAFLLKKGKMITKGRGWPINMIWRCIFSQISVRRAQRNLEHLEINSLKTVLA